MSQHDARLTLQQMLEHATEAVTFAKGKSREVFKADRSLQLILARLVEIVGEASTRLGPEFQTRFPEIPWQDIVGMRHRIAHAYDRIDLDLVWDTVNDDLPALILNLEAILRRRDV